jgi:biotin operon repressor
MRYKGCLRQELAALGVSRACIEKVVEELRDASR